MFQQTVSGVIPAGLIGEGALFGATRSQPGRLDTTAPANNIMGRAFTVKDGGTGQPLAGDNGANPHTLIVQAGGAGAFAGILWHPKVHVQLNLTAQNGLGALPNGVIADFAQEHPGLFVSVPEDTSVGDFVYFLIADGSLLTATPDADVPAGANTTPIGRVERFDVATPAGGLAVAYIGPVTRPAAD